MRLALRHQILLITLLPVLVIDIFFTFRHYTSEAAQANAQLASKAEIISRHLASASEIYLFSGNVEQINRLLEQSISDPEVTLIKIHDRDGMLVAEARSEIFDGSEVAEYYYKRTPVSIQDPSFDDIFYTDFSDTGNPSELGWVHLYLSQKTLQQAISRALLESLLLFALILVLAAILSELVSRRISLPVSKLLAQVKKVESGDLYGRIDEIESNELGEVQRGFNQMTESLQNNQEQMNQRIAHATEQLNDAIADLEEKNIELSVARDEAQHANRIKSVFLANMSHEIRTPINGIHGFVGLLAEGKLDDTQKRYVEIIDKSVVDLTNIINEILDFSKIESGKLRVVSEVFDLYDVIEQTRDILYLSTLSKHIECYLIIYSDVPRRVVGDKLRLKQILLNLIGNAIKFTDEGYIAIKVSVADESTEETDVKISIEDSGIGISESDQQHLFEAFTQVENEENRRFQGTGLGLVISQNLASLLGGQIFMHSEPGRGSTFDVLLPLKKAAGDAADEISDDELTAMAIASTEYGLKETASLLARNGAVPETLLVSPANAGLQIRETLQQCHQMLDIISIDTRQLEVDPLQFIPTNIAKRTKIFMMVREGQIELPQSAQGSYRVPVTISSQQLFRLINEQSDNLTASMITGGATERQAKQVLLVDDNQVNLTLGEELLKNWGHQVTSESRAARALELFEAREFDFVILDIQMPEIDGVTLMHKMRLARPQAKCLFIAMTATVVDELENQFIASGFDYYLSKPIDKKRFRSIVEGRQLISSQASNQKIVPDTNLSFDYDGSLSLSTDKPELLKQILHILLRDIPGFRQQLQEYLEIADRDRLKTTIHKIHGVTCYCSLPRLKNMVAGVEDKLHDMTEEEVINLANTISGELLSVAAEVKSRLQKMVA